MSGRGGPPMGRGCSNPAPMRTPNCRCAMEKESTQAVMLMMRQPTSELWGVRSSATTMAAGSSGSVKMGNSWW